MCVVCAQCVYMCMYVYVCLHACVRIVCMRVYCVCVCHVCILMSVWFSVSMYVSGFSLGIFRRVLCPSEFLPPFWASAFRLSELILCSSILYQRQPISSIFSQPDFDKANASDSNLFRPGTLTSSWLALQSSLTVWLCYTCWFTHVIVTVFILNI